MRSWAIEYACTEDCLDNRKVRQAIEHTLYEKARKELEGESVDWRSLRYLTNRNKRIPDENGREILWNSVVLKVDLK